MLITLTESAGEQIKDMMAAEEDPSLYLRFGIKGGGCSGLSYSLGFDDAKKEDDRVVEASGLTILIDADSAPVIHGTTIDYKQNMIGGGFTIDNPNALVTCGCGSSFKTATNTGAPEKC